MRYDRIKRGGLGLAAALALTSVTVGENAVQAQPGVCAVPKGGEGSSRPPFWALRLMAPWTEVEGEWSGGWTPVGDAAGHYRANWAKHGERTSADLQINPVDNSHVTIIRTQPEGTCKYSGTLWSEGWQVTGTYTCSWSGNQTLRWSAQIARGYQPEPRGCDDGNAPPPDPRLGVIWHEHEGEWVGSWTPVAPPGDFRAGWHKGRESTNADLHMTIDGDQVRILRSQGQGVCHYEGRFFGNGWVVGGTYYCSWNHNRMHWSARVGDGAPPSS